MAGGDWETYIQGQDQGQSCASIEVAHKVMGNLESPREIL